MHTIILPYFSEAEIDRYELILDHMLRLGESQAPFEFLLAASPRIEPSERLYRAASRVAPSRHFQCPTQVFGYPEGPTAMFRDCMWHGATDSDGRDDFVLWMESDMCPVKPGWLDRLDHHWRLCGDVYAMGCVIPALHGAHRQKFRLKHLVKRRRSRQVQWIAQHINGGACYRRDLIRHIPLSDQRLAFDMEIGAVLGQRGGFADTPAIAFSTLERIEDDLQDPEKVLLHGYLQDKEAFLDCCTARMEPPAKRSIMDRLRRRQAKNPREQMLEAILAAKERQPAQLNVYVRLDAATPEAASPRTGREAATPRTGREAATPLPGREAASPRPAASDAA